MAITGVENEYYSQIASGSKVQSAKDGASELAIIEKEKAQVAGYDVGTRNAEDGKSVLDIADASLGSIGDSLSRIRDLALKASNSAIMSSDEKKIIQTEIDQLKQGISDVANYTEFNTKKLLDGSNEEMQITTGANGSGQKISTGDATLEALGIKDFDVTGDFSIKSLDDAIKMVQENRSSIGAQSNSLDYTIGYNTQTSYNLTAAMTRMSDTDIEKAVSERDKQRILETYQIFAQKRQEEEEKNKLKMFTQ